MKKILVVTLVLMMVTLASTAMAVQMVWQETDNDILLMDGDNVQFDFYSGVSYSVDIQLSDPGYNTLTWSVAGVALDGWESSGRWVDTFSIVATLNGNVLEAGSGIVVPNANGTADVVFFNIDLGLNDLDPPFIGSLNIATTAYTSASSEYWNLLDAKLYSCDPVPEPATLLLLGSGLVGLAFLKRRKS